MDPLQEIARLTQSVRQDTARLVRLLPAPALVPAPAPPPGQDDPDFTGLLTCFRLVGRFAGVETLAGFARRPAAALEAFGWITPATCGRHLDGYAPAGPLLTALHTSGYLLDYTP